MARQTSKGTVCGPMCSELAQDPQLPTSTVPAATCGELHPGSSHVPICLMNMGTCPTVVPAKVFIGKAAPTNQVPLMTLPTGTLGGSASGSQKDWILDELNFQGLEDWPEKEQRQARELLTRWEHLFTHSDLDLGKMSLTKHQIELTHQMPFKEDGPHKGQGIVGQFHCPLWTARKDAFGPREKLWEWTYHWPLQVDWYQEVQDKPIPPQNRWSVWEVQLYLNQYAGDVASRVQFWLVYAYSCTHNSAMSFHPYLLMYSRQSWLPIDAILGVIPKFITMHTTSKYVQKLRDCIKWAYRKADLFQRKEVQHHKQRLWQMQQGSILEDGRHGPCPCHCLQGQAQNSGQMGQQGVCGGMAALPKPTSICGMSHRQWNVQPYPAQKLPVAHELQSGTVGKWKLCEGRWIQWWTNSSTTHEWCIVGWPPDQKLNRWHA